MTAVSRLGARLIWQTALLGGLVVTCAAQWT